jgi:16S rRNA (uracil1498-N3)-methyltransferase
MLGTPILFLLLNSMSGPRFFHASPIDASTSRTLILDAASAAHVRVLRLREGDSVVVFDGTGGEWYAVIDAIGKRDVQVSLHDHHPTERESARTVTLVQALATGDKMDWIVQKATELGAHAIQPVHAQRATAKLTADRADKRVEHWRAVAIAACEQCGRNRVPELYSPMDILNWLATRFAGERLILQPGASPLHNALPPDTSVPLALLIGPEGGFTPDEITAAVRAGVTPVSLGPRVLRTETAGLAALATIEALTANASPA